MDAALYMDAEIKPHRSLSRRGVMVLVGAITFVNLASALVFLSMGAHFVPIFLGADVLAVIVALTASFRSARWVERVRVSAYDVRVTYELRGASSVVWESPTAFTRVSVARDPHDGYVTGCTLSLSGRKTEVAAALSPKEREAFAKALETALWRAKRGG